jgi:DNA-directed RNA polymerase specialized sigma24 family protein
MTSAPFYPTSDPKRFLESNLPFYTAITESRLKCRGLQIADAKDVVQKAAIKFWRSIQDGTYDPQYATIELDLRTEDGADASVTYFMPASRAKQENGNAEPMDDTNQEITISSRRLKSWFDRNLNWAFLDQLREYMRNPANNPMKAVEPSDAPEVAVEADSHINSIGLEWLLNNLGNLTDEEKSLMTLYYSGHGAIKVAAMARLLGIRPNTFSMRRLRVTQKITASILRKAQSRGFLNELSPDEREALNGRFTSPSYRSTVIKLLACLADESKR